MAEREKVKQGWWNLIQLMPLKAILLIKKNTQYNLNFLTVSDDVSKRGNSEFTDFIQLVQYTIFLKGKADKKK